jgi:hypothetical protein
MRSVRILGMAVALASCAGPRRSATPEAAPPAVRSDLPADIRRDAISAHVRFLADDLLEGRGTGERGHRVAASYVASQLHGWGIEPAGDQGTYLQEVPMRGARVASATMEVVPKSGSAVAMTFERDFVAAADLVRGDYAVEAPAVFVGYGVASKEYSYDDLHRSDVRGKVAFVLEGAPLTQRADFFPDLPSAVASDRREKIDALANAGAVGVVFVRTPRSERNATWQAVVRNMRFEHMTRLDGDKPAPGTQLARFIVPSIAFDHLLAGAGRSERLFSIIDACDRGSPQTFDIGVSVRLSVRSPVRSFSSPNVVGRLPADPASPVAGEAVLFSAHLDHMGIGDPVAGDSIYNGAGDDAAGCACVLEIARAFAEGPRPKRTILFAFFTGEERGLLGSEHLAMHPPVPLDRISVVLQSDFGAYPILPLRDVEPLGADHSSLETDVKLAARAMSLTLSPDSQPTQTRFIRSDHYQFVKRGVPAMYAMVGLNGATDEERARVAAFHQARYHQPADEWEPRRDYQPLADYARFVFLVGRSAATRPDRIRWNPKDFFERFGTTR